MRVINLASGSDGNLTYIESQSGKILIDDGISCLETEKRLDLLKVNPSQIDAIFLTHMHTDHIKGVDAFSAKYNTPVFAHDQVWGEGLDEKFKKVSGKNRKVYDSEFAFKDFFIIPTEISHDVKCFAYTIQSGESKVSVVTDLGKASDNDKLLDTIKGSKLVYLEANYDKSMLANGTKYPLSLKRRIAGPHGHLSNDDSAKLAAFLTNCGTRQIVLSHLSKENNTPDLAYEYICNELSKQGIEEGVDIRIDVASPNPGVIFRLK